MYICVIIILILLLSLNLVMKYTYEMDYNPHFPDLKNIKYHRENPNSITNKQMISANPELFMTKYNYENRMKFTINSSNNNWADKQENSVNEISYFNIARIMVGLLMGKSVAQITGGSSGNYFYQWYNLGDFIRGSYGFLHCLKNGGVKYGDGIFLYYIHGSNSVKLCNDLQFLFSSFSALKPVVEDNGDISVEETKRFVNHINSKKPKCLMTYPAILFKHAQNIYKNDIELKHFPDFIDISAEFLFTCQYMFIKNIFKTSDIRMSYGSIEVGQVAQQIPFKDWKNDNDMYTYEIFENLCNIENVGDDKMVITSKVYHCLPIIRYKTDDIGIVNGNKIYNLVGKNPGVIELNNKITKANLMGCNIIDLKIKKSKIHITALENNDYINVIFGNNSEITICNKLSCKTLSNHNKKIQVVT